MIILPSRNGMLLRNSNGIISSDCGGPVAFTCPCELLTGTNCSCFWANSTPSTYIADFGVMGKYCLEYVSGCTWQVTVGTITVTLNLTYATNTTRLTAVDGLTTVFSGDLVETDCDDRKYGIISNMVSPSDWGDVAYSPACVTDCYCHRQYFKVELSGLTVLTANKYYVGRIGNDAYIPVRFPYDFNGVYVLNCTNAYGFDEVGGFYQGQDHAIYGCDEDFAGNYLGTYQGWSAKLYFGDYYTGSYPHFTAHPAIILADVEGSFNYGIYPIEDYTCEELATGVEIANILTATTLSNCTSNLFRNITPSPYEYWQGDGVHPNIPLGGIVRVQIL